MIENEEDILKASELTETNFPVWFARALCFLRLHVAHCRCSSVHSRVLGAAENRVHNHLEEYCFVQYFQVLSEEKK